MPAAILCSPDIPQRSLLDVLEAHVRKPLRKHLGETRHPLLLGEMPYVDEIYVEEVSMLSEVVAYVASEMSLGRKSGIIFSS